MFSRNGETQHVVLKPAGLLAAGTLVCTLLLATVLGGSYLYLRDDVISASYTRQAAMQHAYEDRITALRAQVDLVTSRQLLDQQAVESRVSELMQRQNEIGNLQQQLHKVMKRTGKVTNTGPQKQTQNRIMQPVIQGAATGLRLGSLVGSSTPFSDPGSFPNSVSIAQADPVFFDTLEASLEQTERAQIAELKQLKKSADTKVMKLARILSQQGIRVPDTSAVGGPLIELKSGNKFMNTMNALDASLEMLEEVRRAARSLPHGSPAPGKKISSGFGSRRDPFTKSRAMHGGLDFKAGYGSRVVATAAGRVTKAGNMGGYGNMVELDHGGGITTRYAHLSKILVQVGQNIKRGTRIGKVGSSGRSTGPHLHYEVRRKGQVLDPIHYVRLAKHISPYLRD